jgi:DNA-binding NtrC family response regulator
MRRGARDYVLKPWDNPRLVATLATQVELGRALRRTHVLEDLAAREQGNAPALIARSRAMQPVLRLLERVAASEANVLITGEHGTGKEVVARALHVRSARARRPFVPINAGGLSEGVFESELFGHVKGAFTDARADRVGCFELAGGGTLFLDEIGNMPPGQQQKLLRALQTGEFRPVGSSRVSHADVRVLSATNADLGREVREGRFREDLLYRLNTVEIALPPLRERREDLPELAAHFLAHQARRYGRGPERFSADALEALLAHPWPGNVRELEHVVERGVRLADGPEIRREDLVLRPREEGEGPFSLLTLEEGERRLIEKALSRHEGNVTHAAKALGVSRSALYRRLQHFGIKASERE